MIARPRTRRFLFVSTALLVSVASARAAHAESAPARPACYVQLLPTGNNVPANLPAMVIDDQRTSPGLTATVEITSVTNGITLGKIPDPIVPKTTLLVPSTNDPLQIGTTYQIDYTVKCSNDSIAKSATASFVAGAAVALPTKIGTAKELETGAAVVTPTSELAAFMRTTRIEAFVDGESLGSTRYGAIAQAELDVRLLSYGLSVGGAFANAAPKNVCTTTGKEKHDVKLVAHVAGTDTDTEPLSFSVTVDCADPQQTGGSGTVTYPDGGADDRGASSGITSGPPGGCAVGGGGPLGPLAGIFATGAGLAVLLRRRRRAQ